MMPSPHIPPTAAPIPNGSPRHPAAVMAPEPRPTQAAPIASSEKCDFSGKSNHVFSDAGNDTLRVGQPV